jgi:Mrp family chromosome partitioning ATPase
VSKSYRLLSREEQNLKLTVLGGILPTLSAVEEIRTPPELPCEVRTSKTDEPPARFTRNGFRHLHVRLGEDSRLPFHTDPPGLAAEQFRLLRRILSQGFGAGGILLITSPDVADGKTLTSLNLCTCLADSGDSTLLVEVDVRRPAVRRTLGCAVEPPGIEDVLEGTTQPYKAVYFIEELSFHAAMVARIPDDPARSARLINRGAVKQFLAWAREHFHWVVLDAAPALPGADVSELVTLTDGALLIVRAQRTPRELSKRAIELLGKNLCGVIFNGVTTDSSPYYRYLTK